MGRFYCRLSYYLLFWLRDKENKCRNNGTLPSQLILWGNQGVCSFVVSIFAFLTNDGTNAHELHGNDAN